MNVEDREFKKLLRRIDRAVRAFPTDKIWFKDKNRVTFVRIAINLVDRGLPEKYVVESLHEIYHAVADEYGD